MHFDHCIPIHQTSSVACYIFFVVIAGLVLLGCIGIIIICCLKSRYESGRRGTQNVMEVERIRRAQRKQTIDQLRRDLMKKLPRKLKVALIKEQEDRLKRNISTQNAALDRQTSNFSSISQTSPACIICLDEFKKDQANKTAVCLLRSCGHYFHLLCFLPWLEVQTSCPMCRSVVEPSTSHIKACTYAKILADPALTTGRYVKSSTACSVAIPEVYSTDNDVTDGFQSERRRHREHHRLFTFLSPFNLPGNEPGRAFVESMSAYPIFAVGMSTDLPYISVPYSTN